MYKLAAFRQKLKKGKINFGGKWFKESDVADRRTVTQEDLATRMTEVVVVVTLNSGEVLRESNLIESRFFI